MNNNIMNNNINNMSINSSVGSINSNTNNSSSNISNLNLTPQGKNILNPLGYNSNSPQLNQNLSQQNQQNTMKQNYYINPNISLDSFRKKNDNEDISLKDEKSSENLSEDNMNMGREYQPGNKMGNNPMNNMGGNINNNLNQMDMNKNPNEFINQEMFINPKFISNQNNFFPMAYNMNGINNLGNNRDNINNLNNINSLNNINKINSGNYPPIPSLQTYSQSPIPIGSTVPTINTINKSTAKIIKY